MQGIENEVAGKYNLGVRNIQPYKDIYIINTTIGKKVLKKSPFSPERILFIHGAKEHLYKNNFKNLDRYLCTIDGSPYIILDEEVYTVTDLIEGRECNFDSRDDIIKAANLLACLHKASKGYIPPDGSKVQDDLGKLPSYFNKRLIELRKLRKIARKGKSRFDHLFLQYVDYFYDQGEKVINKLTSKCYENLVNNARQEGGFCHHDFTHGNLICSDGKVSIINFDYCCFELKVYDIANFLRRKMRKSNWAVNEARAILNEYQTVEKISSDEFFVMKLVLQFPQKFWRVANKYYNSRRSWAEKVYYSKLQEVIDEVKHYEKFMERVDSLM